MGFDLYSRKNKSYFRVTQGFWPHLRMALVFLGADVSRMALCNEGDYVPAKSARQRNNLKMSIAGVLRRMRGKA